MGARVHSTHCFFFLDIASSWKPSDSGGGNRTQPSFHLPIKPSQASASNLARQFSTRPYFACTQIARLRIGFIITIDLTERKAHREKPENSFEADPLSDNQPSAKKRSCTSNHLDRLCACIRHPNRNPLPFDRGHLLSSIRRPPGYQHLFSTVSTHLFHHWQTRRSDLLVHVRLSYAGSFLRRSSMPQILAKQMACPAIGDGDMGCYLQHFSLHHQPRRL